jgi:hypothetical protein
MYDDRTVGEEDPVAWIIECRSGRIILRRKRRLQHKRHLPSSFRVIQSWKVLHANDLDTGTIDPSYVSVAYLGAAGR